MRAKLVRPTVIVPFVVIVVGAAVWLGFKSGTGSASTNTTAATKQLFTVAPTTMNQTVSASGTIAPADTQDLNFAVAGTVETVNVKAGQTVKKGQVLATVGSAALLNAVAQAKATLVAAQATLSDDRSAGASSAQITNDEAEVASNYATLLAATSALSDATLTSPIAGTVATVNLTVGEVLSSTGSSGTDLSGTGTDSGRSTAPSSSNSANNSSSSSSSSTQIEVISSAYVVNLSVDTTTLGNLKVGQSATVTPTSSSSTSSSSGGGGFVGGAFPGGFSAPPVFGGAQSNTSTPTATGSAATGTVTSVGAIASSSSGVATFPVVVAVKGTASGFHAGASASTVITYKSLTDVLAVPTLAVTVANGESTVTVATNGSADGPTEKRVVTTGITSGGQIQITSGLQAGDQVVITVPARRVTSGSGGNGNGNGRSQLPGGGEFPGVAPNGAVVEVRP